MNILPLIWLLQHSLFILWAFLFAQHHKLHFKDLYMEIFTKISITEIFFILYVSGKFPWRFWRDLINSNASYGNFNILLFVLTSNIFFMCRRTRNGYGNLFEIFRDFYGAWRKFLAIFKRICPTALFKNKYLHSRILENNRYHSIPT